ncbi:DUF5519 family protein [Kitasatospora nipponensis]|uniref:DUF5519 family protein n=1 Tax=Kitasatospora nipponensis TaxID=258049 RepID=A0ABP4GIS8_9ACTN
MDDTSFEAALRNWPGLHTAPASCGTGWGARTDYREVIHLHSTHQADIHLSNAIIEHLRPELTESAHLRLHPGSGWVTVHLDHPEAGDLVLTLVSLALAANTVVKTDHLTWRAPCPRHQTPPPRRQDADGTADPEPSAPAPASAPRAGRR